jgi:hypothetical protein
MTKLFATSALVAILASTAAHAGTILVEYDGQGERLEDGKEAYDFFSLERRVKVKTDMPVEGQDSDDLGVQLRSDGLSDFLIRVNEKERVNGSIALLNNSSFDLRNDEDENDDELVNRVLEVSETEILQSGTFAYSGARIATFGENGLDGFKVDESFDYLNNTVSLFDDGSESSQLLASVGDSAILGFKLTLEVRDFFPQSAAFIDDGPIYCDIEKFSVATDEDLIICGDPKSTEVATLYGFIEVTRGSVTPGLLGVNTSIGQAAVVPGTSVVPLPAPALMLGAGLLGLAGLRRRKS